MASFNERVYALVRQVPPGRVMTYGAVARALGAPRKARQVGWALHRCPDDVPAQRVISHQGEVSGSLLAGRAERRRQLLEAEGVRFNRRGRCDLRRYEWLPQREEGAIVQEKLSAASLGQRRRDQRARKEPVPPSGSAVCPARRHGRRTAERRHEPAGD